MCASKRGNEFHATHTSCISPRSCQFIPNVEGEEEREGGRDGKTLHGVNDVNNTQCLRGEGWVIGMCARVCVRGCLPYSFFCVCLPFVCVHGWQRTRCHAPSALPLWQAVCVCLLCACVDVCLWNPVRATETAWVGLWEHKCMSVRGYVSGSLLLYQQDSVVVLCV